MFILLRSHRKTYYIIQTLASVTYSFSKRKLIVCIPKITRVQLLCSFVIVGNPRVILIDSLFLVLHVETFNQRSARDSNTNPFYAGLKFYITTRPAC